MPQPKRNEQFSFKGFVVCDLPSESVDEVIALSKDPGALWDGMIAFMKDLYKVSVGPIDEQGNCKAVISDIKSKRSSFGWCLTGEGPDAFIALAVVLYKHTFLMGRNWEPFCVERAETARIR